jgi:hypothetical protein
MFKDEGEIMITYITTLFNVLVKMIKHSRKERCNLLQEWTMHISSRQLSSLLSALRGTDINGGDDNGKSKRITRMIRYLTCNNVGKRNTYLNDKVMVRDIVVDYLTENVDDNPHWVHHILSASKVLGHEHPSTYVREYWRFIYHNTKKNIKSNELTHVRKEVRKEQVTMNDMFSIGKKGNLVAQAILSLLEVANETDNKHVILNHANVLYVNKKPVAKIIKHEYDYDKQDTNLMYELYVTESELIAIIDIQKEDVEIS